MGRPFREYIELLEKNPDKTCFIIEEDQIVFSSEHKGVKPMIDYYEKFGTSMKGLNVLDRIVGKGAIMLASLIGAEHVITPVISEAALDFALNFKIKVEYSKIVPYIINRTNDGQCPIERSVIAIDEVSAGYRAINETLLKLKGNTI